MPVLRDVVGHEQVKKRLKNALTGRVNHAYLFGGPPGVGKKTAGLAFARALLCQRGKGDACGECDDCTISERGVHPDLHIIRPEGASIKIHQLRAMQDGAAFTAFGTGRQVFLVEQAEKMSLAAANCFLKILEEPPSGVVFILITDDLSGMLPTVMSRCQQYRFGFLSGEEVLQVLANTGTDAGYDDDSARVAATLCGGCPGRALAMLNGSDKRGAMLELLMRVVRERPGSVFAPVEELAERENLAGFINYVILFFRDVLIWQITGSTELVINVDRHSYIVELAGAYAKPEVMDILVTAEKASGRLASNVNQRLVLDSLLFKIAGLGDNDRG
ncbi:DNA polymerase III subunit delta' [Desulfoscipio gibsoniae]|uniref:DNA polymerase III, delta'' subunit n=1 Tax=Desulfoscipio gibsoniae DSM 7213 TaxID=767817 RepID=R4KDC8_9FIRM|nr:DNA polymerase III subunit delta' [Desulfoscipio gibsoniae]AGK99706.1 DNA polymerase III, delta'' subunit [Desulfoscipio gibsoniae DSM 7213]